MAFSFSTFSLYIPGQEIGLWTYQPTGYQLTDLQHNRHTRSNSPDYKGVPQVHGMCFTLRLFAKVALLPLVRSTSRSRWGYWFEPNGFPVLLTTVQRDLSATGQTSYHHNSSTSEPMRQA